jgi:hypothetical protein
VSSGAWSYFHPALLSGHGPNHVDRLRPIALLPTYWLARHSIAKNRPRQIQKGRIYFHFRKDNQSWPSIADEEDDLADRAARLDLAQGVRRPLERTRATSGFICPPRTARQRLPTRCGISDVARVLPKRPDD